MIRWRRFALCLVLMMATVSCAQTLKSDDALLSARRTVWEAWFAGDTTRLEEMLPSDTIVMSAGETSWKNQQDVLREAREFHDSGGKLVRLEFPRTEVQHFGDVAVIWSDYRVELRSSGKKVTSKGRVTEVFVLRNGRWTNPGWHTEQAR